MPGNSQRRPAEIGHVPSHWQVAPLSAFVSRVTYGFTNPMPTVDDGPFMVTAKDIHDGRIDYSTARHTDWKAYWNDLTDKSRPRINDVLLTKDGSIGRVAICDREDICINQSVALIQPDGSINPRFLLYILQTPHYQRRMEEDSDGTTIKHIYITRVDKMEVAIPPLAEQDAIVGIVGRLDDKIELCRRMKETLEAMARALFKSWFVDFDLVRAKAEGRDPGLPKPIADLFPARLVDSELGEIPEGWTIKPLDKLARFVNGLALQKYPPANGKSLPVIKIVQLRARDTNGADRANADLDPDYIVQDGDILFSWSGSLECALWAGGPGALNQHLFKVTPANYPRWLCYLGIHLHLEDFRHIAAGKATTMGHIQRHHLSDASLVIPPPPLMSAASTMMEPMVESLWRREVQSRTLAAIRDALLPKLISGELRVKGAERVVAEAAG
jgi:type I restriction enzyme S subunit